MRDWRDTQLAVGVVHDRGPFSSPAWKTRSPPRGGSAFSPLPTPTACKFGARPASPIQYGRKRIIEKPILECAESHGWIGLFLRAGNMSCTHPLD